MPIRNNLIFEILRANSSRIRDLSCRFGTIWYPRYFVLIREVSNTMCSIWDLSWPFKSIHDKITTIPPKHTLNLKNPKSIKIHKNPIFLGTTAKYDEIWLPNNGTAGRVAVNNWGKRRYEGTSYLRNCKMVKEHGILASQFVTDCKVLWGFNPTAGQSKRSNCAVTLREQW